MGLRIALALTVLVAVAGLLQVAEGSQTARGLAFGPKVGGRGAGRLGPILAAH